MTETSNDKESQLLIEYSEGIQLIGIKQDLNKQIRFVELAIQQIPTLTSTQIKKAFQDFASGTTLPEIKLFGNLDFRILLAILKHSLWLENKVISGEETKLTSEQIIKNKNYLDNDIIKAFNRVARGEAMRLSLYTPVLLRLQEIGFEIIEPEKENVIQAALKSLVTNKNANKYDLKFIKEQQEKNQHVKKRMKVTKAELQIKNIFDNLLEKKDHIKNYLK